MTFFSHSVFCHSDHTTTFISQFSLNITGAFTSTCPMSHNGTSLTPSKTDNGTPDSTYNETKTLRNLLPALNDIGNLERYDTSLSVDPRSELDPSKTIIKSDTCTSRQSSTIVSPNAQSCNIGVSRYAVSAVHSLRFVLRTSFVDWKRLLSCSAEPSFAYVRMASSSYKNILQD